MNWHTKNQTEILQNLNTHQTGLNASERQRRLEQNGPNQLTEKQQLKTWQKIAKHYVDFLMIILMIAGILKGITGDYTEMIIILAVVLINGLISYLQERKAEESLSGLKQLVSQEAVILTENQRTQVATDSLVVGDIVLLKSGDLVPADLRLIQTHDLVVEESALTGESLPVEKHTAALIGEISLGDRTNLAFSGTQVQAGSGIGVVIATADQTEIGQINEALQSVKPQTTPLVRKMNQLNQQIFKGLMGFILFLIFFTTFRYGMEFDLLLSAIIALIVAVVPEGLPAVLTMILSMGVNEMSKEKAIVKSMPAVETLGAMTVICSDKTGTLTKNEMTVTDVVLPENTETENQTELLLLMNNCQDLRPDPTQKVSQLKGNPTEMALLQYAEQYPASHLPRLDQLPFDSKHKYMATLHQIDGQPTIFVKGAPEVLLAKAQLSHQERIYWLTAAENLAQNGQRVLAFARKATETSQLDHEQLTELTIVGLTGIIDPPKESAIQAVRESQQAGINVKMITGDHKETARAIGEQIGLHHTSIVLEGVDIDLMNDTELAQAVQKTDIFARTTPEHKLRIVTALQEQGEVVGMTGDGVNDAPALKKADIGIAMGIKGSEVTKQAADMVLADDNFATITRAVKEGRRIFDNLKKTINFFLPSALAQGLLVIFTLMTNRPLPLTPVQILWVNMVTTVTLSYALGFEKAHPEIMSRTPRDPQEKMLSGYSLLRIVYVSLLITVPAYILTLSIDNSAVSQTMLLQSIVLAQALYMINCRELVDPAINASLIKNRAILISLAALFLLQGAVIFLPFAQQIIGTTSLSLMQHSVILLLAIAIFLIVEVEKWLTKKIRARNAKEATA